MNFKANPSILSSEKELALQSGGFNPALLQRMGQRRGWTSAAMDEGGMSHFQGLQSSALAGIEDLSRLRLRAMDSEQWMTKVPIQVNKNLAYSEGMKVIESGKLLMQTLASDGLLFTEIDL